MKNTNSTKRGFTLVELLIAVAVVAVLSGMAYVGIQKAQEGVMNEKVKADLLAIANAIEQFERDNDHFPLPVLSGNKNVLCFDNDLLYSHDCTQSAIMQAQVDNTLLTKRYLQEVPTDPRTGSRYSYGVTTDGRYYQLAGNIVSDDNDFVAVTQGNINKNASLPSLIRSFNGPNFVIDGTEYLPYSPDHLAVSGTIHVEDGMTVTVDGNVVESGGMLKAGQTIETGSVGATIYLSDGSITYLDPSTTLTLLPSSQTSQNDEDGIVTKIRLKLFSGKIWNKVVRLAEKSEFNVETTSAIAGVRGTEFGVDAHANEVVVLSGAVAMRKKTDDEMSASGDTAFDFDNGELLFADNQIAQGDGQTLKKFTIPDADEKIESPAYITPTAQQQYIEKYYSDQMEISLADIPYLTKAESLAGTAGIFKLHLSFNGYVTEDVFDFDGIQVFYDPKTRGSWTPEEDEEPAYVIPRSEITFDETERNYIFELQNPEYALFFRAYSGEGDERLYSDVSSPTIELAAAAPSVSYASGLIYDGLYGDSGIVANADLVVVANAPKITKPDAQYFLKGSQVELGMANITSDDLEIAITGNVDANAGFVSVADKTLFDATESGTYSLTYNNESLIDITFCDYVGDGDECWLLGETGASCTDTCSATGTSCVESDWNVSETENTAVCTALGSGEFETTPVNKAYAPYITSTCAVRDADTSQDCTASFFLFERICKCD